MQFRRAIGFAILIPGSVLILAGVVCAVGFQRTLAAVGQAGVWAFVAVGVLTALALVLQAAALAALNRPIGHRVPFLTLVEGMVVALAGNVLTPTSHLGGEPFKVAYIGRMRGLPYQEVAGTVLLSKYLELLSFILLFGFSTAVAALGYAGVLFHPPYTGVGVAMLVLAGALLGVFGVLWVALTRRWRPLTRVVSTLALIRPLRRRVVRLRRRAIEMEDQVSRVFCEEGRVWMAGFGLMLASHAAMFIKPLAFFLLGARLRLGVGDLGLIFVASQLLLSVQFTPSGVGMLDAGLIGTFALLRVGESQCMVGEAQCMAYLLCLRLWDAVAVGLGALLAARVGARFLVSKPPPIV